MFLKSVCVHCIYCGVSHTCCKACVFLGHLILFMLNTPPHTKQQYPIVYYIQLLFRRCDPNIKSHPAFVYGKMNKLYFFSADKFALNLRMS